MPESSIAITAGTGTNIDTWQMADGTHRQFVIDEGRGGGVFRASTFRTPGRAGTTGQKIFTLFNTSATIIAEVQFIGVDLYQTVVKAVTVAPPIIRTSRLTAAPTGGTVLSKVPLDSTITSNASVVATGDASADGTGGTALVATPAGFITQEYAPRLITAAGYEPADRVEFMAHGNIVCRQNQGIVINLDYTLATQNPTTDMWIATVQWTEY